MARLQYLIFFLFSVCILHAQPRAEKGVLDLRAYDFAGRHADLMVPLDGEWEFYWNKIHGTDFFQNDDNLSPDYVNYTTPWSELPQMQDESHQFGYATLRLKVLVRENLPSMSLYLPIVYSAYDLYVNNEGFEGNGLVGTNRDNSIPYWRPSSKVVQLNPGENELIVHMSNFHHDKGGAIKPIELGTSDRINFFRNFKISSTLFLAGCLLIAGALAFGFYWFNPTDHTGLFFFLFCVTYMYRLLGTDQYVIHAALRNIPWSFTLRLEYLSLYLSVIFYTYFIRNLIQPRIPLIAFHIVGIISTILAILTVVLPTWVFTIFINYYLAFILITMLAVGFAYMMHINLLHKTTYVTALGAFMLFLVAVSKILEHFGYMKENLYLTSFSYVGFIFTMAIAMTIRFGRNFRESNVAARIASKSKDQFLNTMSHELRTPMNAILGMTDLLEKTRLEREQKEQLSTIKNNGESLLAIIMDILSITDMEGRKIVLEKKKLSINECIEGAYNLAARHRRVKVEFIKNIHSRIPAGLAGDSIRLKQVLMHLLSNAFKFTEEGMVTLDVELLNETEDEVELKFIIEDTGIGLDASTRESIFKAFSQVDAGNNRKFGGVGLGLTVVKQMVALMGGSIELDSEQGKGTRFWFNLKFDVVNETEKSEDLLVPTAIDKDLKILYAEDNPVNQKLLTMMLKSLGLNIETAVNGKEAWEMAKRNSYDIVLMDIQMPEMDGIEAARRIIDDVEERPIIIAVTANATIADKKKCFEVGMNDFIAKPIKAKDLKEGLLKWQSLRNYADGITSEPGKYIQLSS